MKSISAGLLAAVALAATSSVALAEAPKFTYSFNIGGTTDYVFRGYSQTGQDPTIQGGADFGYGIAYVGIWASGVDFGDQNFALGNGNFSNIAHTEVDVYGGIKPTWGPVTFDLGVIAYLYPGARDGGPIKFEVKEQDYVEIKGGASGAIIPMLPKLTLGGYVYYSPEYQGGQNEVWTTEATAAYELPAFGKFTPTISALIGAQYGDAKDGFALGNGEDSLLYWNAGITLAVEKFSFDFRYWDTDVKNNGAIANWCKGSFGQCDERFAFTAKFTY